MFSIYVCILPLNIYIWYKMKFIYFESVQQTAEIADTFHAIWGLC